MLLLFLSCNFLFHDDLLFVDLFVLGVDVLDNRIELFEFFQVFDEELAIRFIKSRRQPTQCECCKPERFLILLGQLVEHIVQDALLLEDVV